MKAREGRLIALDGVDGAGKSLQVRRLASAIEERGLRTRVLREPGGTTIGERLREVLLAAGADGRDALLEALLFMASRRQLVCERIQPALAAGDVVLLDRSFLSTWVYQGVVGGVDLALLEDLARRVHGSAWPDRILLLDLEAAEAMRRRTSRETEVDGFEGRGPAYLARVALAFRGMATRHPDLVRVVPAIGTVDEVAGRCLAAIEDLVPTRRSE